MGSGARPYLEIAGVSKAFDGQVVLKSLSIDVARGEFVTLLGPSGCGKTTLLRLIAGLLRVDSGSIMVDGRDLTRTPVHRRNVGLVFQTYALFPHLNVWDNVAFGLKAKRMDAAVIRREVDLALGMVQLDGFETRSVRALSGGQQQRVSLARAIVTKPAVMLLDEPFSALDRKLRESMQIETRQLLRTIGATSIFVTHDQEEALVMSDRVMVMNSGQVEQAAAPKIVYNAPATPFVLGFVGQALRLHGRVVSSANFHMTIATAFGTVSAFGSIPAGDHALVAVRPECIRFSSLAEACNTVRATVRDVIFLGSKTNVLFAADAPDIVVAELSDASIETLKPGAQVDLHWRIADTLAYAAGDA
jgi:putative spermidine/putrescine transport system ATP-binding protein